MHNAPARNPPYHEAISTAGQNVTKGRPDSPISGVKARRRSVAATVASTATPYFSGHDRFFLKSAKPFRTMHFGAGQHVYRPPFFVSLYLARANGATKVGAERDGWRHGPADHPGISSP